MRRMAVVLGMIACLGAAQTAAAYAEWKDYQCPK